GPPACGTISVQPVVACPVSMVVARETGAVDAVDRHTLPRNLLASCLPAQAPPASPASIASPPASALPDIQMPPRPPEATQVWSSGQLLVVTSHGAPGRMVGA